MYVLIHCFYTLWSTTTTRLQSQKRRGDRHVVDAVAKRRITARVLIAAVEAQRIVVGRTFIKQITYIHIYIDIYIYTYIFLFRVLSQSTTAFFASRGDRVAIAVAGAVSHCWSTFQS